MIFQVNLDAENATQQSRNQKSTVGGGEAESEDSLDSNGELRS